VPGICTACGQLYCGKCFPELLASVHGAECPKCRKPWDIPDGERVRQLQELIRMREAGRHTVHAMTALSNHIDQGEGTPKDPVEAIRLLKLAAEGGFTVAVYNLGNKHRDGDGVEQDFAEAIRCYRAAAADKFVFAWEALGRMYDTGRGVDEDKAEAKRYYTLAANQGAPIAQYNLAAMHFASGEYAAAATWCKRAADKGEESAASCLPVALNNLFPPGTNVELVNMRASVLDGLRGVVDTTTCGKIVYSAVGKIFIMFEGSQGNRAVPFENLIAVLH
jgi:tetratricopeptide (TPR) repeat protein